MGYITRYKPTSLSPKARAQRLFNRMTQKCEDKLGCTNCGYDSQCERLYEFGIKVSDGIMYQQRNKEERNKITKVFATLDRR